MTIYRPTVAQEMGGDHSINKALRNQYGGFDLSKAKDFFSHARKQEEAKKYFDPLEGMQSVDSMSKHEQMDMIRGKHVGKTENISPLQSVNAGVDFFKKLREGK